MAGPSTAPPYGGSNGAPPHMPPHPAHHLPMVPYPPPYPPHYMYGPPPHVPGPMPPLVAAPHPMPPLIPLPPPTKDATKKDESEPAGQPDNIPTPKAEAENGDDDKASGEEEGKDGKKGGLELLASLALPGSKGKKNAGNKPAGIPEKKGEEGEEITMPPLNPPLPLDPNNPNAAAIAIIQKDNKNKKKKSRMEELDPKEKLFVEKVRECDVLCGRGGKSNHHPGNKRYRQVVSEMKRTYQSTGAKTAKTDLSRAIVEHVVGYGGRFIKRDESTGQYFLLTKAQARRKTSQALRETKELKWTM